MSFAPEPSPPEAWWVYLIEAENGYLYTGISTDPERRILEHKTKKTGAKFFRRSPPKRFIFKRGPFDRSTALRIESKIKKLKRDEKLKLKARRNLEFLLD